jgi:hypothetical protein
MGNIDIKKLAIAGGILYAAYKFAPNQLIKGGVLSVAAVLVAKQVPFVNEYVA